MKKRIEGLLQHAFIEASKGGALKSNSLPPLVLELPKDAAFGDLATPVALAMARAERRPPRAIAEVLVAHLADPEGLIASTEIAGPGYINIRLSSRFWQQCLAEVAEPDFAMPAIGRGQPVLVEFVSGNPTGPLHVGHGRGAVTGDVLARLLVTSGHAVVREYYVNDAGKQIETLGRSLFARLCQVYGDPAEIPAGGYPGEYLREIAERDADLLFAAIAAGAQIAPPAGAAARLALLRTQAEIAVPICARHGSAVILEMIKADLALCDIHFDCFVSERELRDAGAICAALEELRGRGLLYREDGAEWFSSSRFGDEKDRVVVRSDGELTYFASDIGYHRDKLRRGFETLVNVWGADHHGYIDRVRAAIGALGHEPTMLQVLLVQIVNLTRGGQPVRMGKRSGEFVTLREVIEEVGADATRFFFLMRKSDSQLDFDLDLAKSQSAENPVFYVQYAHARCCSLLRQAALAHVTVPTADGIDVAALVEPEEIEVFKRVAVFRDVIEDAVREREPHRLVFFLIELAGCFHRFYNRHRVLGTEAAIANARLYLVRAVQHVIRRGLHLLGVTAPEEM